MSTADVLCVNEVIATFTEIKHFPCHFRTALCPDRCGHARDSAIFKIDEYLKYEKPGQYGDEKQENFMWNLKPEADSNKLHPEYLEVVKSLQPGQKVKINWTHFYVHDDNGAHPERSVTFFEKI
ncbi:hypothetical protein M9Y10_012030 [Tritrichomonas musculus]|uniref:Uncharacterized protein n=1 Tax=Tritrichomonas musculus TaxID=1915356 RepID=A0ABR2IC19_9EUKA